jgi:small-conductance mechanosensitive channel
MNSLNDLLADLKKPDIWEEILGFVVALAVAYALTWWLSRHWSKGRSEELNQGSVWLGSRIVDGVMFPLLALVFAYIANRYVGQFQILSLLKVAVPILLALVAIRLLSRTFALSFPNSLFARMTERMFSWMAWVAVVLWVTGLLPTVSAELAEIEFPVGNSKIDLRSVLAGVLLAGTVIIVTLWFSALIERRVLRGAVDDLSMRKIMASGIRAALLLIGVLFALNAVGIDLSALSVMGGALGIGIGLGLQGLAANYVSGVVILFERSIRIGDYVRADDFQGTVKDIFTRYTLIQNLNGVEAIVPNLKLTTAKVENLEQGSPKECLTCSVTVAYGCVVEEVQRILLDTVRQNPRALQHPAPAVYVNTLALQGIDLQMSFWVNDPQNWQQIVRSEINVAALNALSSHGFEMALGPRKALT